MTAETLLEDWRDGRYLEVADAIKSSNPTLTVAFCHLLVKYQGVNELSVLKNLLDY